MDVITTINGCSIFKRGYSVLPHNAALASRARALRKAGVLSEVIFWKYVRNGVFWNIDFDRQRVIGNFIVDFFVKDLGLVVEIDGSSHNDKEEYDAMREEFLKSFGLVVYRISDYRVKNDLDAVLRELEQFVVAEFGSKL